MACLALKLDRVLQLYDIYHIPAPTRTVTSVVLLSRTKKHAPRTLSVSGHFRPLAGETAVSLAMVATSPTRDM